MRSIGRPIVLVPDVDGLVVVGVDRDPDALAVEAVAAVRRSSLVDSSQASSDRLGLEVVAEAEVAGHLEERAVPGGLADLVDVEGADALLDAGRPLVRRRLLADEVRHELHHAGVDEQQVRVLERQRRARHDGVAVGLEVVEEPLPDLGGLHRRAFRVRPSAPSRPVPVAQLVLALAHRLRARRRRSRATLVGQVGQRAAERARPCPSASAARRSCDSRRMTSTPIVTPSAEPEQPPHHSTLPLRGRRLAALIASASRRSPTVRRTP